MFTTLISCQELSDRLGQSDIVIVDCRHDLMSLSAGREAYQQDHIPGAVYLDVYDDLSGPPVTNRGRHPLPTDEKINALFGRLGLNKNTQVVVYDDSYGAFAARLWWMCQYMRHESVAVLDGGWQAWLQNGLLLSEYHPPTVAATDFTGESDATLLVDIEAVLNYPLCVDSREPPRYRGEVEPIDPIAGHIPDAINRFWKDNLANNGQFKAAEVLRQEFSHLLGKHHSEQTVIYCGSGVTACHNLLAVRHAGLPMPRLYAGSWSEWSNTPGKPVATGCNEGKPA